MGNFTKNIAMSVRRELVMARSLQINGQWQSAFKHLENAHVLGQLSTYWHTRVHILMLLWAWQRTDIREVMAQIIRITGAATKTFAGLVPAGNTGGGNVSAFKPMPVSEAHRQAIISARLK